MRYLIIAAVVFAIQILASQAFDAADTTDLIEPRLLPMDEECPRDVATTQTGLRACFSTVKDFAASQLLLKEHVGSLSYVAFAMLVIVQRRASFGLPPACGAAH
jgi:hypothetical protein